MSPEITKADVDTLVRELKANIERAALAFKRGEAVVLYSTVNHLGIVMVGHPNKDLMLSVIQALDKVACAVMDKLHGKATSVEEYQIEKFEDPAPDRKN